MGRGRILLRATLSDFRLRSGLGRSACRSRLVTFRSLTSIVLGRALILLILGIPRTTLWPASISLIPLITIIPPLVTLSTLGGLDGRLRTLTLRFFGRTLETTQLLAQRFNFALISRLLALGLFEKLKHFVHLIERLAKRGDDHHNIVNCFVN